VAEEPRVEGGREVTRKSIPDDPVSSRLQRLLFRDAFRYSVHMANLSYSRLCADLLVLSRNEYSREKEKRETLSEGMVFERGTSALTNAWQVVDSVNRLRGLLQGAPGMRRRDHEYKLFLRHTENVEHVRDNVQHLNSQIREFVRKELPAWGVLNWASKLDESDDLLVSSFVPGELFPRTTPVLNPVGRGMTIPIGLVTLYCEKEVCLSDIIEIHVRGIAGWLQRVQGIDFSSAAPYAYITMVLSSEPDRAGSSIGGS